jgi:hypothetical protein
MATNNQKGRHIEVSFFYISFCRSLKSRIVENICKEYRQMSILSEYCYFVRFGVCIYVFAAMCETLIFNTETQGPATEHCPEPDESNILYSHRICFKPTELLSHLCPAVTTCLVHSGILANIFHTSYSSDARMCVCVSVENT